MTVYILLKHTRQNCILRANPRSAGMGKTGHTLIIASRKHRRRENMVGVNMVSAEYSKFQTWLLYIYLLFAIWEGFDGILLKPCLLQPCVHVAGNTVLCWTWLQQMSAYFEAPTNRGSKHNDIASRNTEAECMWGLLHNFINYRCVLVCIKPNLHLKVIFDHSVLFSFELMVGELIVRSLYKISDPL